MSARKTVLLISVVASGALTATAAAGDVAAKLTVSPSSPRVSQSVKVTFNAPHAISAKEVFSVVIRGEGKCVTSAAKYDILGPQRKNGHFVVILRPTSQIGPKRLTKWCRGKAKTEIVESKGAKVLGTLAVRSFRFR